MPRKARAYIIARGLLYHIVCRGNNQRKIFRASRDYKKMLSILKETKKKNPFYLYVYSLMPNHYHLAMETKEVPISKIMHQINNDYVKFFRHRYKGSGHLFEGRYFAKVIDKDAYLWELGRYIDLNAVRARLVRNPQDYHWSSYQVYLNKDYDNHLVNRDLFLGYLNDDLEKARVSYIEFVEEGLLEYKAIPFPITKKMI